MIRPAQQDDVFLADVTAACGEPQRLHIWWLGQSGFLVQWRQQHLLFDPYLSDSLTAKYAQTDKPHVRMSERVVDPARLNFVDVVTSSHNHTDHLDGETLLPLRHANPNLQMVIPETNRAFVADRLATPAQWPQGCVAGQTVQVGPFRFTGVPAAHEELETDGVGRHKFLGYIVQAGPWTLYHSGDTVWYPGMVEILREWSIDVALLPINGSRPERRVAGNLDGVQAARLAHQIRAGVVIPCHYDMFTFNTESPDAFVAECQTLNQPYQVLQLGARWRSPVHS